MKLLEYSKNSTGYKIVIWLDETKHDLQGRPYEEWCWSGTWGLDVPTNEVSDGKDKDGKPKTKQVPAMKQPEYEKSLLEEAKRQAQEMLSGLTNSNQQVVAPKTL